MVTLEAKLAYFLPFKRTSDHAKTKKEVRYGKRVWKIEDIQFATYFLHNVKTLEKTSVILYKLLK